MADASKRVAEFAGALIYYDRPPSGEYGERGTQIRPFFEERFAAETEAMFAQLFAELSEAGAGAVTQIYAGSMGCDPRAGGRSYAQKNRAFDLDGLAFDNGSKWMADSYPFAPHLYLAIESAIRMHFGTVLTYSYDRRNEDRIYFDNGRKIGFHSYSKSRTVFLQNCLYHLFDMQLSCDGVLGPETKSISDLVRRELEIGPFMGAGEEDQWLAFLKAARAEAFRRASPTNAPG